MISLRRYYHRRFGHHERFHLAVILTIVVVAYVAVPRVVRYVDALQGYAPPAHYEPKDVERQEWLRHRTVEELTGVSFDVVVDVVLFILVAIVWLTLVPVGVGRHRSPPR